MIFNGINKEIVNLKQSIEFNRANISNMDKSILESIKKNMSLADEILIIRKNEDAISKDVEYIGNRIDSTNLRVSEVSKAIFEIPDLLKLQENITNSVKLLTQRFSDNENSRVQDIENYERDNIFLQKELNDLNAEFVQYRDDCNARLSKFNILIDEKFAIQKQDVEILIMNFGKELQNKLDKISVDHPMTVDLLKKIAKLEGVKDAVEHRKPAQDLMNKIGELNDLMLVRDREEKDVTVIKSQIDILKWALGEI